MTLIICRLHGGGLCDDHCKVCDYFDASSWHCSYYQKEIAPSVIAAKIERNRQRKIDEAKRKETEAEERRINYINKWKETHRQNK